MKPKSHSTGAARPFRRRQLDSRGAYCLLSASLLALLLLLVLAPRPASGQLPFYESGFNQVVDTSVQTVPFRRDWTSVG